jgi:putative Holliday junction resolvase
MSRILAIDFGTKRIGAAVCDASRTIASPLEQYQPRDRDRDAAHYQELVREERIERIVVGLPLHTTGREGNLAARARDFGQWLGEVTGRRVVFFDERFTTAQAEEILLEHRVTSARRRELRDRLAAQILLQAYIDSGCPEQDTAPLPLDDPPQGEGCP